MNDKYILKGHKAVPASLFEWGGWLETHRKEKIVKQEELPKKWWKFWAKPLWVSTVFLGLDHNFSMRGEPLIFETMVFRSRENLGEIDMARYSTWEEAEKGHKRMVKKWLEK